MSGVLFKIRKSRAAMVAAFVLLSVLGVQAQVAPTGPPSVEVGALIDYAGTAENILFALGAAFVAAAGVMLALTIGKKAVKWLKAG
jgi:hypothetical protein